MDNPATESSSTPLDVNGGAALFASMIDSAEEPPKEQETPEPQAAETEQEPVEQEVEETSEDDPTVTVKIDGQDVEVKLSELKNGYQRQADYTRKTMQVAEQRKAAEAELQQARVERENYAKSLQQTQALLQAQLTEQQNVDWQQLLENDPVEYLKQQHLAQQRHAQLQQITQEQQKLTAMQQAEAQQAQKAYLEQQAADLLAKLPEWKDESKAKAEKASIRKFLNESGYADQELDGLSDHRSVLIARKAMLYDQMVAKAQVAAKQVSKLPQKVERPGNTAPSLDKRSAAFQRLSKTGRVEDAAAVFANFV